MSKNATFHNIATGLLAVCAVIVTILVVRREFQQRPRVEEREVRNWQELIAGAPAIGEPSAPVNVVLFSDFQCPACARANDILANLRRAHPGRFVIFFRHYPLSDAHPHAMQAAIAAECARRQDRFKNYHDLLFSRQFAIGSVSWVDLAEDAGVIDLAAFTACLGSPAAIARVRRDIGVGDSLGLDAVPTFVIDGRLASGSAGIRRLQRTITDTS